MTVAHPAPTARAPARPAPPVASPWMLYAFAGRPMLAVPAEPRSLRAAAMARFQPFSLRRAVYRGAMRASMWAGIDGFLGRRVGQPALGRLGFPLATWLDGIAQELRRGPLWPAVFWPPQAERGRIYVHLLDGDLGPVAFAKVSLGVESDRALRAEGAALEGLAARPPRAFRVPSVLARGLVDGHEYLLLEPSPRGATPRSRRGGGPPRACLDEIGGGVRARPGGDLTTLSWWGRFAERIDDRCEDFVAALRARTAGEIRTRRVHGDFIPANLVAVAGTLWVVDWEASCEDGPATVDELAHRMAVELRADRRSPAQRVTGFVEAFWRGRDARARADAMLALAFRHAFDVMPATSLIRDWATVERAR